MVAVCSRKLRLALILVLAVLLCGCATYPAFENPDIDYNGRWDVQEGGWGAYYNPGVSLYDETPDFYGWDPMYTGSYYHYRGGDDPHRYRNR